MGPKRTNSGITSVERGHPSDVSTENIIGSLDVRITRNRPQPISEESIVHSEEHLSSGSSLLATSLRSTVTSNEVGSSSINKINSQGDLIQRAEERVRAPKKGVKRKKTGHIGSFDLLEPSAAAIQVGDLLVDRVTWPSIDTIDQEFFSRLPHITFEEVLEHLDMKNATWCNVGGDPCTSVNDCINLSNDDTASLAAFNESLPGVLQPMDYTHPDYFNVTVKVPGLPFPQLTADGIRICSLSRTPRIGHPLTKFLINDAVLPLLPLVAKVDGEIEFPTMNFSVPYEDIHEGSLGEEVLYYLPLNENNLSTVAVPRSFILSHTYLDNLVLIAYCMSFLKGGLGSGDYSKGLKQSHISEILERGNIDELGALLENELKNYSGEHEFEEKRGFINLMGDKQSYRAMTGHDFVQYVYHSKNLTYHLLTKAALDNARVCQEPASSYTNMAHCAFYSIPAERSGAKLRSIAEEIFTNLSQLTKKDHIVTRGYDSIKQSLNLDISLKQAEENLIFRWFDRLAKVNSTGYEGVTSILPSSIVWYYIYQHTCDSKYTNTQKAAYMLKGLKRVYILAQSRVLSSQLQKAGESLGRRFLDQCRGWEVGCEHHREFRIPDCLYANASCLTMTDLENLYVNSLNFKAEPSQYNRILSWILRYALLYEKFGVGIFSSNFSCCPTTLELIPWRVFKPFIIQVTAYAHFPDLGFSQPVIEPLVSFIESDDLRGCIFRLAHKALCAARYQLLNGYHLCGVTTFSKELLDKFIASYYLRDILARRSHGGNFTSREGILMDATGAPCDSYGADIIILKGF